MDINFSILNNALKDLVHSKFAAKGGCLFYYGVCRPCIPIKTCRRLYVNPETAYSNVLPLEVAISKHNLKNGILIKQTAFLYVLLFVMYNPSVGYTLLLGHPNTFFQVTVYKHDICVRGNRHYSYKHY